MKNKKIIKRNGAVAGVIEALLLVALVSIIISTIQLTYIPQTMEQKEAEHMDDVENQFSYCCSQIVVQIQPDIQKQDWLGLLFLIQLSFQHLTDKNTQKNALLKFQALLYISVQYLSVFAVLS